jgi:hypothetical protein
MKLLLISITTVVILLGLFLSLLIIFSIPTIPIKYASTISFYDGQTNQIIPNQHFRLSHSSKDSLNLENYDRQTDDSGFLTTELKRIEGSKLSLIMHSGKYYGDKINFSFTIRAPQIEEEVTIYPDPIDRRPDNEQRKQPLTPPRLEIKFGKKKSF